MALVRRGLPQRPDEEAMSDQREAQKATGGGRGGGSPAPMSASAPSFGGTAGTSGGQFGRFVSLGEYLGQNQPQAERMASKVGTGAAQEGAKAQLENKRIEASYGGALAGGKTQAKSMSEFAPERYAEAQKASTSAEQRAQALGTVGGVQEQVRQAYAQSPSTAGEALMDAALTQQAGGRGFGEIQSKYGNLQQMLSGANERSAQAFDKRQADLAAASAAEEERKRREAEAERQRIAEERQREIEDSRMEGVTSAQERAQQKKTPAKSSSKRTTTD